MLEHDRTTDRFIGARYAVSAPHFLQRMRELLIAGWEMGPALEHLLDEAVWSPAMAGVEPLLTADDVLAEAQRILHEHYVG
ncbi:MAG TPA: hypothetical protein VKV26_24040 [Dehalococcoidia bacterium]|nr:hypothetical protein [Dehalococcoidia bacterium]